MNALLAQKPLFTGLKYGFASFWFGLIIHPYFGVLVMIIVFVASAIWMERKMLVDMRAEEGITVEKVRRYLDDWEPDRESEDFTDTGSASREAGSQLEDASE